MKTMSVMLTLLGMIPMISLTASAATITVSNWSDLKKQVKNASKDTTIILSNDITTNEHDNRVIADKKKNVTVDLNGHSIKKDNGTKCYKDGHIFEIQGDSTFTLTDSVGGGKNTCTIFMCC